MTPLNIGGLLMCLVALALGRERLLDYNGLSAPSVAAWLGLLALPLIPFVARPRRLRNRVLGVQRAIAGALALLGIYGGIKYLGAPLSIALGLLDTIVLLYRDDRSAGRLSVPVCIFLFIAQASWDLRYDPHSLAIGLAWAGLGLVGRVWNYVAWQSQSEHDEAVFWILFLPLFGSAVGGFAVNPKGFTPFPVPWWPTAIGVAALGLAAFVLEGRIVAAGGSVKARLTEITAFPALWAGHWFVSNHKPGLTEGIVGLLMAAAAGRAFFATAPFRAPA